MNENGNGIDLKNNNLYVNVQVENFLHHLGNSHDSICLLLSHGMSILNLQVRSLVKLMFNGCLKINSVTFFPQLDLTCLFGS